MQQLSRRGLLSGVTASVASAALVPRALSQQASDVSLGDTSAMAEIARGFLREFGIPGLSAAIAVRGTLAYAEGFGVADMHSGTSVAPSNLFRIASVSKPITSVAIFKLVERGRLKLSDRVFGPGGVLHPEFSAPAPILERITVEHLLTHAAGGWGSKGQDPMFQHPEMNHRQLISWTLDNFPLSDAPGSRRMYSNFGYCFLDRVIEKVARQSYFAFVHDAVLKPCGISSMRIAGNTLADRAPKEVRYDRSPGRFRLPHQCRSYGCTWWLDRDCFRSRAFSPSC